MRITIGCLILTLACMSCRGSNKDGQTQETSTATRVNRLLKESCRGYPFDFEVRGPVTLDEFRGVWTTGYEEWAEYMRKTNRSPGTFEDSSQGRQCARLETQYTEGDELYFFRSEERSWSDLSGMEGYVLIRAGRIVDDVITKEN
jgi:hypothetical protein